MKRAIFNRVSAFLDDFVDELDISNFEYSIWNSGAELKKLKIKKNVLDR